MTVEEWRPVKGYEDWYSVSSFGRVKCIFDFPYKGFGSRLYKDKMIIDFDTVRTTTYMRVGLTNPLTNTRKTHNVHRLMLEAFVPNDDNKPYINHIDGNKHNNLLSNLEWCTASENTKHAWDNNLCTRLEGEDANHSKYTEDLVYQVLDLYYNDLETCHTIAKIVKIHAGYVRYIVRGKRWMKCYNAFREVNIAWFDEVSGLLSKRSGNNTDKINKEIYALRKRLAQ